MLLIFILTFFTSNYLFSATELGSYYQNFLSELIGTVMTVSITELLLKKQAESEEIKNQNIELFKKKAENYENIMRLIVKTLADKKIGEAEVYELKNAIYNFALFSSEKMINILLTVYKKPNYLRSRGS